MGLTWWLLSLFSISCFSQEATQIQFVEWMQKYHRVYDEKELLFRYNIFADNAEFVEKHNAQNLSYTVALNQFADLSKDEFKSLYMGYDQKRQLPSIDDLQTGPSAYPDGSVDWVAKGAVTGVKDQKQCGGCWAFSATGATEGLIYLKHGVLKSLSEQQLLDCSSSYGNAGCNGGLMTHAFAYIKDNGLCSEADYPYKGVNGRCNSAACTTANYTKISGYSSVNPNEQALGHFLDYQPISIAIEADQSGFQLYSSGVFDGTCGNNLDHGVLAVGYGTDPTSGKPYWKVKNSWGINWGEQGYIRMVRNKNECGISDEASYPSE